MRYTLPIAIIALFAVLALSATAQTSGCCCNLYNGTAQVDSYLPSTSCLPAFPDFVVPTTGDVVANKTCSTKCGEVAALPPSPGGACGSPAYKPAPVNFTAAPVKGTRAMHLTWFIPCSADSYIISRCTGASCSSFAQIAVMSAGTSFVDGSADLRWNTDYTYRIIAHYSIQGDSAATTASGNVGDIECESRFGTDSFCISAYTYELFKTYLQSFGYAGSPSTPASSFTSSFDGAVTSTFFSKFNKGASCDAKNKLALSVSCGSSEICVPKGSSPVCITPSPCSNDSGVFGLSPSATACEGTTDDPNYCFLDKSATSIDSCYPCSQALTCYDYKSKGACERNNCFTGSCAWKYTYPDLGVGVCLDTRFNNCPLCNKTGTPSAPNLQAYNAVFDQCSPSKVDALTSDAFPCFYSGGAAVDCGKVTCKDYTPGQCGSPSGGVTLNSDNSIASASTDPCKIGVCQFDSTPGIGCRKNADGTPASTYWLDCGVNDTACERDHYPPDTVLITIGSAGKYDYLNIRIWDKSNGSDFGHLIVPPGDLSLIIGAPNTTALGSRKEIPNWRTYFCAGPLNGSLCTSFISVNSTQLNINDLALQDGTKVLFNFTPGWNKLRYYTQDPSKNLEIMKNISIYACTACQGPKVLSFNLSPGNFFNGTYYTRSLSPSATISFNEPGELVFAGVVKDSLTYNLTRTPASGHNLGYAFTTPSPLTEGAYVLSVNARDSSNVFMDAPIDSPFVVDITPPLANYTPTDGTEIKTGSVTVTITFNEPVTVQNFTIEEFVVYNTTAGPVRRSSMRDVSKLFIGSKNTTFTATLTLSEGRKILRPIVTDFAGNPLSNATASSTFVINALAPIVTLKEPRFGVSSTSPFPVAVETDSVAECRYWSSQTIPAPGTFSALIPFTSTTGFEHRIPSFSELTKENITFKFFVKCVDDETGTGSSTFFLSIDKSGPKIISAFAAPNPIVQMPMQTALKVRTDDLSICKYSASTTSYDSMEGEFPYFDIFGLTVHVVNVTVAEAAKSYSYNVACKNVALLGPASAEIKFSVDLTIPLKLNATTPAFVGNTSVPISVETNKDAYCYYKNSGTLLPLGTVNSSSMVHVAFLSVPGPGPYSIPVFCSTGAGTSPLGIEEKNISVNFFVDLTPPWMVYADDSSNNKEFPQYSYFLDKLRIAFLGADNESNISRYHYRIEQQGTGVIVKDWTPSTMLKGLPWYVTPVNVTNGLTYYFRVTSENRAGLLSSELPSDGVIIDITKIPPHCLNSEFDPGNETDVDCGGSCPPCADYLMCEVDVDCISRICNAEKICQPTLCDDLIIGGNETDVDCGGGTCGGCDNGKACAMHSDCKSHYCENGICTYNACYDQELNGLESDVDCGGSCPGCPDGKSCLVDNDCATGACINNVCASSADEDFDGVPDGKDNCPGTPYGEVVDEFGCSASQRFSCGDAIDDAWRIRYFGDVLCEGDGAANADPDGDNDNNLQEYRNGTDPTKSDRGFPWVLLIVLLILAGAGWAGWYLHKHPELMKFKFDWKLFRPKQKIPVPPPSRPTIKPEAPHVEQWLAVEDLKKLGPEDVSAKTFSQLDSLVKGTLPSHEHAKLLKRLEQEKTPLDKLRELALAGLSKKEREDLLLKLRLLRRGKLSKEDTEELFRKLRITAEYYSKYKDQLEKELESYVRGQRVKRIK